MGETPCCPDCGHPVAGDEWSEDLCPHCLLRLALEESSGAGTGDGEATAQLERGSLSRGRILGSRYGIRKLLGRGGMGEVWRAFDLKLRVDVALKTVRPELSEKAQVLETLRQEVRAAREVVSANVCRVHDLLELEGRELVSMEYVDGTTLLQLLEERGPIALQEAREIAAQFLSGLDAIHRAGLVHRDIKPENLMITRTGRVVVMDFGIAKGLAAGQTGTVAGTPAYMAPEQARGEAVDPRADVFAAGVVLAEMLAPSSDREAREALWRGIREEPPRVPESPWQAVVETAVSPRREHRYAAASALARALEEVTVRVEGAEDVAPYPGLSAFTVANREYFFGRELEAEAVWNRIRRLHLLALIGPSGAGKTSFLQAGILASAPAGWTHVICTPGVSPLTGLRQALAPHLSGDSDAIRELVKVEDPEAIVSAVSRWRKRSRHALLIVDQFEELFTLNPPEVQAGFATLLGRLAVDADLRVLLSMRDDFLVHCHAHEALRPILSELTLLGPPSAAALRRAVVQPALKCGYRFEDEALVDRMLSEVEGERGALPLLAFAAEQLWQRRDRKQGVLTREGYELIGGVSGALAQHAELTLERIGPGRASIVRELFRNLLTAEGTRAVREREELLSVFSAGGDRRTAGEVLDALIGARLLTSYGTEAGDGAEQPLQQIEIVHESLLAAWPRLVRWQAQDVEGARLRDDLRQAARRWQERDRPDDLLWTGSAYREYQVWREKYPGRLSEIEEAFASAMARRAARQRRRRRAMVGAIVAASLTVATVTGALWRRSEAAREQARAEALRAEAGKLLALGRNQLEADTTAALAYARASLGLFDTPETRRFVLETLWRGPVARLLPEDQLERQLGLPRDPEGITKMVLSPDGRWLALALGPYLQAHQVLLLDRDGGPPRALPLPPAGTVNVLAFGPQSDLLIIGGSERNLRLLSLPDLKEIRSVPLAGLFTHYGLLRGDTLLLVSATAVEGGFPGVIQALTLPDGELRTVGINRPYESLGEVDPSGTLVRFILGGSFGLRSLDGGNEQILGPADEPKNLSFFPQGDRVAVSDMSTGETRILPLDRLQGPPLRVLRGPAPLGRVGFDPEGRYLTQGSGPEGTVHIWDLEGPPDAGPTVLRRGGSGEGGAFTPDARWFISSLAGRRVIELWAIGGPLRREFPGQKAMNRLAFTADGRWLAACHGPAPLRLLPLHAADGGTRLLGQPKMCFSVATHPTEDLVLESTQGTNVGRRATVLLHSLAGSSRELAGAWSGSPPWALAFDAAGRRTLASPFAKATGIWDPASRIVRTWELASGRQRDFSVAHLTDAGWKGFVMLSVAPDGTLYGDGQGGVRKLLLPEAPGEAVKSETVYAAAFAVGSLSRDGHRLLVAAAKEEGMWPPEELALLDLERGTSQEITTHGAQISHALLSPSGRAIVTASPDGTLRVGPATGEEPHLLLGHQGAIQRLAISPDERWVASASADAFYVWPMPDVTKPPLHTLPHEELLARLNTLTNLRVVRDAESSTGWTLDIGPFPGWKDLPTW
jgi:WD40 repeat protein